jgi:hypothetical protein
LSGWGKGGARIRSKVKVNAAPLRGTGEGREALARPNPSPSLLCRRPGPAFWEVLETVWN